MRKILGVEFGSRAMRGSIIETRFRSSRPVKWEEAILPPGKDERVPYIVQTLRQWKKSYGPDSVVVGLPLKDFSHQFIDMPVMGKNDMRKALMFELEKYLPLPVDEYVFDSIPLPGEKGKMKVLVFSIRKESVNAIVRIFQEAGFGQISMRCSALSSFSGLLDIATEKRLDGVFVNATDDSYEVAGMKNSLPVYWKGYARQVNLVPELERLVSLYPGKVYFMGNVDASIAEKFKGIKYQILVSHAIAVSAVKKDRLSHNFIAEGQMKKRQDIYPYLTGGLAGTALVVFLLTGLVAYYKTVNTLSSLEKQRSLIKEKASGVLEARKKLEQLQEDKNVLMDFEGRSNVAIRAMSILSETLPKDAWLINFSADDKGKIEIEGFTGAGRITDLVMAIEKSRFFRNVAFSAPIIAKEGEERFALKMEIEESAE